VLDIIAQRRSRANVSSIASSPIGGRPVTISFIPSAGGVGNTTLALETAAYIKSDKATRDRSISLVDLNFQTSHVCDYLDSEPRLLIADFASAPERLDEHLLESFKTRHSSGIDVFAAPRSIYPPENLSIDTLDALLSMIAARYDIMIIIYPLHWLPWTAQIIAASDGVVVTGINTIPCLRQISETLSHIRSSSSPALQVRVAINRCERSLLGSIARRRHAEMALRDEQVFFIGERPEAVQGVNMGVPMVLGAAAKRARREFAPLASFCTSLQSARTAMA
jgi:pilus assembly protein CpaE